MPKKNNESPASGLLTLGVASLHATREGWLTLVNTASTIIRELLSPLTAASSGLGKVIETRFEAWNEAEKVIAAQTVWEANERIKQSGKAIREDVEPEILLQVLQGAGGTTNSTLQDCWRNLLERHLSEDDVHPEFVLFLRRLAPQDAKLIMLTAKLKAADSSMKERKEDLSRMLGKGLHKFNVDLIQQIDFSGLTTVSYQEWADSQKTALLESPLFKKRRADDASLTAFFRNRKKVLRIRDYCVNISRWEEETEENQASFLAIPEEKRQFSIAVLLQLGILTKSSIDQNRWQNLAFTYIGGKFVNSIV